jgi:hypothetical protein
MFAIFAIVTGGDGQSADRATAAVVLRPGITSTPAASSTAIASLATASIQRPIIGPSRDAPATV